MNFYENWRIANSGDLEQRIKSITDDYITRLQTAKGKDKKELAQIINNITESFKDNLENMDDEDLIEVAQNCNKKRVVKVDFSKLSRNEIIKYCIENDDYLAEDIEKGVETFESEADEEEEHYKWRIVQEKMNWAEEKITVLLNNIGYKDKYSVHHAGTGSRYIYVFNLGTTIRIADHKQPVGGGMADPLIGTTYGDSDYNILIDYDPQHLNFYNEDDLKKNILEWENQEKLEE